MTLSPEPSPTLALSPSEVTGVILTGGHSRRLGRDKALLPWPAEDSATTLLDHVHTVLRSVCATVLVIGRPRPGLRTYTVIPDAYPGGASLAGLATGLRQAATPWVLALACDLPFLQEPVLRLLYAHAHEADAVAPHVREEPETLCTLYHTHCLAVAEDMLVTGEYTVTVPAAALRRADPALRAFFNLNTPADLARARELAQADARAAGTSSDRSTTRDSPIGT